MNISEYSVQRTFLRVSVSALAAVGATPCVRCPRHTWANRDAVRRASGNPRQLPPASSLACSRWSQFCRFISDIPCLQCPRPTHAGQCAVAIIRSTFRSPCEPQSCCISAINSSPPRATGARNNQVWKLQKWVVRSFLLWLHLHSWCPLLAVVLRTCWWGGETCVVCWVVSTGEWGLEL